MQPVSRIFTTESGVEARENREAVQYLESFLPAYCVLDRKVFNQLLQPNYRERFPKDSDYVKALIKEENIYKRTANSIVRDMNGRIRALKELKKTEIQDMEVKLAKKQDKLKKLDKRIKTLKNKARKNTATQEELEELRWKKQSRYHTKNQINELKQKIQELKEEVAGNRKLSMGFGTRKKFRSQNHLQENHYGTHEDWYEDFVQSRDKNIYYVGTRSESNGNLMAQLTYMEESDSFRLQLTKEKYWQKNKEDQYVFIDGLKFSNLHAQLKENCLRHASGKEAHPVSIRILRRNGRWYVQAMIHIDSSEKWTTSSFYGTIGLDFNNGFIEASRTNQYGKLVEQRHYELRFHGTGDKAETEMQQTAHQIVEWCLETGCMLVIESLDFRKKKAQLLKNPKQKGYNRMISAFDYSRYQRCMENACFKAGVDLKRTDPKWTSRIGKEKYADKLKLSIHQAASYVIARRGQGYYDRLKPVKKPEKKSKEILKETGNREDPPDNVQNYDINDQTLPF